MKQFTLVAAILVFMAANTVAGEFSGNVSGYKGSKGLDDDDWGSFDDQSSFGVISDFKMEGWPVSIAIDGFLSIEDSDFIDSGSDSEIEIDASTSELHMGVRKIWDLGGSGFSPYFGVGLAYVNAYLEGESAGVKVDDDDSAAGYWVGTGLYWRPIEHLNIGLDIRYSDAEVSLFGQDVEAGGTHTGIFVGYHW